MQEKWIDYNSSGGKHRGYLVYNEKTGVPKPAVIVAHAWQGQDDFARNKAKFLAELGYIGFAADLYGEGKHVTTNEEAAALMMPLFMDRAILRDRMAAAYDAISAHEAVDKDNIGAIGFCFGGLAVIELLRSGKKLKGVVSFHGLLGDKLGDKKAVTVPAASQLYGSLLMLHGYEDPLVSEDDIRTAQKTFTAQGVDWQMHIYGQAAHAFTNPEANQKGSGLMYHPISEKRSLLEMRNFLAEVFQ